MSVFAMRGRVDAGPSKGDPVAAVPSCAAAALHPRGGNPTSRLCVIVRRFLTVLVIIVLGVANELDVLAVERLCNELAQLCVHDLCDLVAADLRVARELV